MGNNKIRDDLETTLSLLSIAGAKLAWHGYDGLEEHVESIAADIEFELEQMEASVERR